MIIKILSSHLKELIFMVMEIIGLILSKLSALKFEEVLKILAQFSKISIKYTATMRYFW